MHHGFFFPLALFMCRLSLCMASLIHIPHFLFNSLFPVCRLSLSPCDMTHSCTTDSFPSHSLLCLRSFSMSDITQSYITASFPSHSLLRSSSFSMRDITHWDTTGSFQSRVSNPQPEPRSGNTLALVPTLPVLPTRF